MIWSFVVDWAQNTNQLTNQPPLTGLNYLGGRISNMRLKWTDIKEAKYQQNTDWITGDSNSSFTQPTSNRPPPPPPPSASFQKLESSAMVIGAINILWIVRITHQGGIKAIALD